MKSNDAASANIDGQREPWALNRRSCLAVHDNDIDQRVIDLHQSKRPIGFERPDHWAQSVAGCLWAFAACDNLPARLIVEAPHDSLAAGWSKTQRMAASPKLRFYVRDPGPLPCEIDGLNRVVDQGVD